MESRCKLAAALSRQWFGVLMVPQAPEDSWVLEGLAGILEDLFVRKFLGQNELAFRSGKPCGVHACVGVGKGLSCRVKGHVIPYHQISRGMAGVSSQASS